MNRLGKVLLGETWICPTCRAKCSRRARRSLQTSTVSDTSASPTDTKELRSETTQAREHIERASKPTKPSSKRSPLPFQLFLRARYEQPPQPSFRSDNDPYGLFKSLAHGAPSDVNSALDSALGDRQFLKSIPACTWLEVIRSMSPFRWASRTSLPASVFLSAGYRAEVHRSKQTIRNLRDFLSNIVAIQREVGIQLDINAYRLLLQYAAQMQAKDMSRAIYNDMEKDNVQPDLACFNARMEAIVTKVNNRVKNVQPKDHDTLGPPSEQKLSLEVEDLHRQMRQDYGIEPDTTSYCTLLVAYCCEGDISAAINLLNRVWGVNAQTLATDQVTLDDHQFPSGHPLCPSTFLLSSIADNLGYCNRILTAFQIIDLLSGRYQLPIQRRVIYKLLYWTWFHGYREGREWKKQNYGVPPAYEKLPQLFDLLKSHGSTDATMKNMILLMKNDEGLHQPGGENFRKYLGAAAATLGRRVDIKRNRGHQLELMEKKPPGSIPRTQSAAQVKRQFNEMEIATWKTRDTIHRWFRERLKKGIPDSLPLSAEDTEKYVDWRLRGIPILILRYNRLAPESLKYQVPGGLIELQLMSYEEKQHRNRYIRANRRKPRFQWSRRARLEHTSLGRLSSKPDAVRALRQKNPLVEDARGIVS